MKANNLSGQAPGGARTPLADVLPLDTPFVVQIFPVYACNFKCSYCIFHLDKKERGFISDKVSLDLALFKKCVDDMTAFPQKIKVLRFVGIGEPLLHREIVEMVRYAAERGVANTIEIISNASLLTPELSDALVAAGLSRLVISIQGTSAEKYRSVCGADIDFGRFVENIRYFYNHRKNAGVYIKIIDCALDGKVDEEKFFGVFGDICDSIAIEHAVPIHSGVNYDGILKPNTHQVTQFGLPVSEVKICPQPFFTMQINPDGKVVPCYSFEYPVIIGDCSQESVTAIWRGEKFNAFRRIMLDGLVCCPEVCRRCNIIKYRLFPEDILNHAAVRLKACYES